MNIIVSSWPAAGGTTRAVLLAYLLGYKFLGVGHLQRFVAYNLIHPSEEAHLTFEQRYGEIWDILWEKYINWKLNREDRMVIDGMITGFFAEDQTNLFEVMVVAHEKARLMRSNTPIHIQIKDRLVRNRWLKKYRIDIFNLTQIELNYDLILDSTSFDLAADLGLILEDIARLNGEDLNIEKIKGNINQVVGIFNTRGLNYFYNKIKMAPPEELLREWNRILKNEVLTLPVELREFIRKFG